MVGDIVDSIDGVLQRDPLSTMRNFETMETPFQLKVFRPDIFAMPIRPKKQSTLDRLLQRFPNLDRATLIPKLQKQMMQLNRRNKKILI